MSKEHTELRAVENSTSPQPGRRAADTNHAAPRKKKWATKVRTGCTTCRIRRIKCDEAKPSCRRCTSTGRKCDGYTMLPVLVSQPDNYTGPSSLTRSTWDERRMFFFFRTETALQVAGPFDQSFWTVDLLRATQVHPAIWHASIAVAAMYKRYTIPADPTTSALRRELYNFSLAQYNASIGGLVGVARRDHPTLDDKDVILATSLLYAGVCSLRGDPREAFLHMRNGLKLFRQWKHWEPRKGRGSGVLPVDSLVTLFTRLDSQALNLSDDDEKRSRLECELEANDVPRQPSRSAPFTSVTEAYFEFELTLNGLLDLMQRRGFVPVSSSKPGPPCESRVVLRNALDAWNAKFTVLFPLLKESEMEAALILRIRHIAFDIAVSIDDAQWELAWDEFQPQYELIVRLSRELLERYHPSSSTQQDSPDGGEAGVPMFSFAASVCDPLYLVASRCRNHALRREAISLLKRWPQRECLWDSVLAATLAESIMLLEEEASAKMSLDGTDMCFCVPEVFICHGHRVADAKLELLGEGVGMVTLRTVNDILGETRHVIQLSW